MFDIDRWGEIWASIRKNKLRTILTSLGVLWGIMMLVIMLGASRGFRNGVMSTLDVAPNAVFVWTRTTSLDYKGFRTGRAIEFKNTDIEAIRRKIPQIARVAPRTSLKAVGNVTRGVKSATNFTINGDTPDLLLVEPKNMLEGRFINELDIKQRRKVAIIGIRVKEILFQEKENAIGEYIKIRGIPFKVVGIFKSKQKGDNAQEDNQTIFIPQTTLQYTFNQINEINYFAMVPQEGVQSSVIEEATKRLLRERLVVHPNDERAIGSANVEEEFGKAIQLFNIMDLFSWLVSILTIVAGTIGISNIMLIIVKERTREIGVRKALGATPGSIIGLILQEAVVITLLAGYVGLCVGVGIISFIDWIMKKMQVEAEFFANPEVDIRVAIAAFVTLIISGTIAGFIPARKASAVHPVAVLADQ